MREKIGFGVRFFVDYAKFHQEIKHMLWGKRFWTKSYCVISVGDGATTAIIEQYIKNQRPI